jgi:hypothetical protein
MYFVRIKPLKERLRRRALGDREALPYYVIFMACTTFVCALPMAAQPYTRWDVLSAITGTVFAIGGVIYSYNRNGGGAGHDFIHKSVVLGWVVMIRLLAIIIPIAIGIGFLKTSLGHSCDQTSWVDVIAVSLFEAVYFQRLGKHIAETNKTAGEPSPPPLPRVPSGCSEGEG